MIWFWIVLAILAALVLVICYSALIAAENEEEYWEMVEQYRKEKRDDLK